VRESAMVGLEHGKVVVADHDQEWADLFQREHDRIKTALGNIALAIEHVGSTSIRGLAAKPIIDIIVAIDSYESFFPHVPTVEKLGYVYRGEDGLPRRHLFWNDDPCTVHLRFLEKDSESWHSHLAFRETMRGSPELRQAYLDLKRQLAEQFPDDREAYTAGKQEFIQSVLQQLAEERHRHPPPDSSTLL
jgi:GrpB-like predicted nucleotidyltransferase (UPF0157 family)